MKQLILFIILLSNIFNVQAQEKIDLLKEAVRALERDNNLKHGILSIAVYDAEADTLVFQKNSELGLPVASTQKIITAISAYELLGNTFKYETPFYYNEQSKMLMVRGSYDPTMGSWRYKNTQSDNIIDTLQNKLKAFKIKSIQDIKLVTNNNFSTNQISDGWIYEDIGNYYGAACQPFNWRENQYEINIQNGKAENEATTIVGSTPFFMAKSGMYINQIKTGKINSGDNTCNYTLANEKTLGKGYLGSEIKTYESGASILGEKYFLYNLAVGFNRANAEKLSTLKSSYATNENISKNKIIYVHKSPILDSINYWFLRKSVNLYGESLLRTMAQKKYNTDEYEKGIQYIHTLCKKIGVDTHAVHLFDGCGLSPQNRVTTSALCKFMQYARKQTYYKQFYNCLPVINDISMKSGSIHGCRAYTGYISSSNNTNYTFAIVVNNYEGSGKEMQTKLWKVLDALK
jgi:serine-type D-Ala-D-Ala carboxypeptidase/endopeptidase (penicillin-binding protein 4)